MQAVKEGNVIVVTMTVEESAVLYAITQQVGGLPTGPRGTIDELDGVLSNAGAPTNYAERFKIIGDVHINAAKEA